MCRLSLFTIGSVEVGIAVVVAEEEAAIGPAFHAQLIAVAVHIKAVALRNVGVDMEGVAVPHLADLIFVLVLGIGPQSQIAGLNINVARVGIAVTTHSVVASVDSGKFVFGELKGAFIIGLFKNFLFFTHGCFLLIYC